MNQYPLAGDYQAALQNPAAAFTDSRLKTAQFTLDSWGLPEAITGPTAAVFHATIGGKGYALRCFTRSDVSSPERYAALDSFVAHHPRLSKHVSHVTWHDGAIRAKGATWPVLQMEWIEGQQLNEYVGYLAERADTGALGKLASRWRKLIDELQRARFAHGDLSHGNVIIDQQGSLRLVDYDDVWIPPLQGYPAPTEIGHENYQPRSRSAQARWGSWMDTFSALVIYLALTALAKDPGLWLPLNNGDNLLFERKDFSPPYETGVWRHLARLGDPQVDELARRLQECCAPGWVAAKSLEETLGRPASRPRQLFFSYARPDGLRVDSLVTRLRQAGIEIWLDSDLVGGWPWWDKILGQLRSCDAVLAAVSGASANSQACRAEREYAAKLGKPILPIALERMPVGLFPADLARLEIIDYTQPDEAAAFRVATAILALPKPRPLPSPLPAPPAIPQTRFASLNDRIAAPSLSLEEQLGILVLLEGALDPTSVQEDRETAAEMLSEMAKRPDLYETAARKIQALQAQAGELPGAGRTGSAGVPSAAGNPLAWFENSGSRATPVPNSPASSRGLRQLPARGCGLAS